jgi:hypothetical protein
MAPKPPQHDRRPRSSEKTLPYSLVKNAAAELCAMLDGAETNEWLLDLAWLGLERPNPEPHDSLRERVTVWLRQDESLALKQLIDGEDVSDSVINSAEKRLADAVRGVSRT